jgi:hypothetical protein
VFDKDDTNELNTYCGSFLDEKFDKHMTNVWGVENFDIVMGNPPYQSNNPGETKTQPIWQLFVEKSINILCEGGYLNMVHPSGWRNVGGRFKETQKILKSKEIIYLEMHNIKDGMKTFGAETRYDFYCLKNSMCDDNFLTKIKCQDGSYENINLKNMEFIPSGMFSKINSLITSDITNRTNILHSQSDYETRKDYISKTKDETYKYPVVYRVKKDETMTFIYSSRNDKGHYNIPKMIWSDGRVTSVGSFIDTNGEYAMNQFQFSIVDDVENLPNIKKAFDSIEFRKMMEYCAVSNMSINHKVIATFRKDFYKQFLND